MTNYVCMVLSTPDIGLLLRDCVVNLYSNVLTPAEKYMGIFAMAAEFGEEGTSNNRAATRGEGGAAAFWCLP